jgi:hypothetical protein
MSDRGFDDPDYDDRGDSSLFDDDLDLDLDDTEVLADPYHDQETEQLLLRVREIVEAAPKVPLSASSMIAKDEVLDLLDDALARLPEELRAARWLLKEREEYLTKARHEADEVIDQARSRVERMVQRTEVVKAAEQRAYEIVDAAETHSRQLQHEVEDFCDQKLASFEIVLERTQKMVVAGRAKLQGTNLTAGIPSDEPEGELAEVLGEYDSLPAPPDADDGYDDEWDDGPQPA